MRILVGISLVLILLATPSFAAKTQRKKNRQPEVPAKPLPAKPCVTCDMKVAPDLPQQLAKWKPVHMPFHSEALTPNEVKVVQKLVQATRSLENIFWRQSDPEGLTLYQQLRGSKHEKDQQVRRFLFINGSRYDLLNENKPFVGDEPYRPGRGFYPADLTREQVEQYVKDHPDEKKAIYSGYTVIRRQGDKLQTIPYSVAYKSFLEPAAKALEEAADFSDDKDFANFLRLRAKALLNDDYYESDMAWMDLKNPKIDVIMAPYETYVDDLLGVKTSYGPAVLIRNEEESKKLEVYQKYIPDLQDALPLAAEDRPSKKGHVMPMEVMDAPYRGGDLRHGYQAVADNLPNDRRVHEQKGSKKIFFKNFMDARVNFVILPIAKLLMDPKQAAKASGEGYMATTLMHEISHGLGPTFSRVNDQQLAINEAIGPIYGALEEAKADIVGLWALRSLIDKGALPKDRLEEYYSSYLAGTFRTLRFGTGEAHGQAEMMEFNYHFQNGAFKQDSSGRYLVDFEKIGDSVASLAKELLEIEATGDRARAEAWFAKYDKMPDHLKTALKKADNVPVDMDPRFSFPDRIE
jgi:hypothetical protein